jgi:tRNA A-37 threonylcarbamoyl transferase component Bud32
MANYAEVKKALIAEYPFLQDANLVITKQFFSESSRQYNTYLVKSRAPGFEQFVAKGIVLPKYSLTNEWLVLKLLNQQQFACPKLLIPTHKPNKFILIEHISGQKASQLLLEIANPKNIFKQIGELTGKFHTIKAPWFGELTKNSNVDWAEYLRRNTRERLERTSQMISAPTHKKTKKLLESFDDLIIDEGELSPVLIHRDIYSDNFIIEKTTQQMYLIDFGMAIGGRPFYDLAKFYIFDLYRFPKYEDDFLSGYQKHIVLPNNFKYLFKLYLLRELLGCINFFHSIGKTNYLQLTTKLLDKLVSEKVSH